MKEMFRKFAECTANAVGSHWAFLIAAVVVVVWALSGPLFGYSDTWQLVINTGTTIVTFLMVFLIQNTQNRSERVVNLKLDELLRALEGARTELVSLDQMSDDELKTIQEEFSRLSKSSAALLDDDLSSIDRELKRRRSQG
jgi:low affinity Fe/Cu permease